MNYSKSSLALSLAMAALASGGVTAGSYNKPTAEPQTMPYQPGRSRSRKRSSSGHLSLSAKLHKIAREDDLKRRGEDAAWRCIFLVTRTDPKYCAYWVNPATGKNEKVIFDKARTKATRRIERRAKAAKYA
jgi:hypothetical protein